MPTTRQGFICGLVPYRYPHPLASELSNLWYQPWQLEAGTAVLPRSLEDTPFTFVDTPAQLQDMVRQLAAAREVCACCSTHILPAPRGVCGRQLQESLIKVGNTTWRAAATGTVPDVAEYAANATRAVSSLSSVLFTRSAVSAQNKAMLPTVCWYRRLQLTLRTTRTARTRASAA